MTYLIITIAILAMVNVIQWRITRHQDKAYTEHADRLAAELTDQQHAFEDLKKKYHELDAHDSMLMTEYNNTCNDRDGYKADAERLKAALAKVAKTHEDLKALHTALRDEWLHQRQVLSGRNGALKQQLNRLKKKNEE